MGVEIKDVNKFLEDLSEYGLKKKYTQVLKQQPEDYHEEKYQDDTSDCIEVYKLGVEDLH